MEEGQRCYRWYNDAVVGGTCTWEQMTSAECSGASFSVGVYVAVYVRERFWGDKVGDGVEATPYLRDAVSTQLAKGQFRGEPRESQPRL